MAADVIRGDDQFCLIKLQQQFSECEFMVIQEFLEGVRHRRADN